MEVDDDSDTHLCLKCQKTITGLDNYVAHRRKECGKLSSKPQSELISAEADVRKSHDCAESSTNSTIMSESAEMPKKDDHQPRPDDFFLSLELQSKKPVDRQTTDKHEQLMSDYVGKLLDADIGSESTKKVPGRHYTGELSSLCMTIMDHNYDGVSCPVGETPEDDNDAIQDRDDCDDEDDDDQCFPPRGHTGGKWKPGMRPDACRWRLGLPLRETRRRRRRGCHRNKQDAAEMSLASSDRQRSVSRGIQCPICSQTFPKAQDIANHLVTPEHWQKSREHPQHASVLFQYGHLLAPMAQFRCDICSFYCNRIDDFQRHWSEDLEANSKHSESMSRDLVCELCDYTCRSSKDMASHLALVPEHLDRVSTTKPLIVKFSDHFRCWQCDWRGDRKQALIAHRRWKHSNDITCDLCEQSFSSERSLALHKETMEHRQRSSSSSTRRKTTGMELRQLRSSDFLELNAEDSETDFTDTSTSHSENEDYVKKKKLTPRTSGNMHSVCMYCDQKVSGARLEMHTRKAHPEKLFGCDLCNVSFVFETELTWHKTKDSMHRIIEMDTAPSVTEGDALAASKFFSCSQCTFRSVTKAGGIFHEICKHGTPVERPPPTPEVEKGSRSDKEANVAAETEEDEERENHGAPPKKRRKKAVASSSLFFGCNLCDKVFERLALRSHLNIHTGERPFSCKICSKSFALKESLHSHYWNLHKEKRFVCPHCSFRTTRNSKLRNHMEIHGNRERKHLCDICGAGFYKRGTLLHHMKLHTSKIHKCPEPGCTRSYRCPSELLYHSRVHTNERPYLCETCGHKTKTRHLLTKHERTHTGEKPFKCPHCNYTASLGPQLSRHMRIHTGSKPYSCPHCPYTCNTQENLRKHVLKSKKHRGLKVYACPHCKYGCNWSNELKEHIAKEHGQTMQAKDDTDPAFCSVITGIYDRTLDKKPLSGSPKPFVHRPKNYKRARRADRGDQDAEVQESPPSPTEGDAGDLLSQVVDSNGLLEIEHVECIGVDADEDITPDKRVGRPNTFKKRSPVKKVRRRKRKCKKAAPLDASEVRVVLGMQQEDSDAVQLLQTETVNETEVMEQNEAIAIYTFELPMEDQAEEGELETGDILAGDGLPDEDSHNAVLLPITPWPAVVESAEQHTLAVINHGDGEDIVTAREEDDSNRPTIYLYVPPSQPSLET